jgi:steroid 5-alpha reductase family enzyme
MSDSQVKPEAAAATNRSWGTAAVTLSVAVLLSSLVCAALAEGTARFSDVPVIWLCAGLAFAIQWIAFVPAYIFKTERYYDLIGTLTYLSVIVSAVILGGAASPRAFIIAALVMVWSGRLGWFLFLRISKDGSDKRFDGVRDNIPRFFVGWTLQGLWVVLTLPAAWVAITSLNQAPLGPLDFIGLLIWMLGFGIESVADTQKREFRANPKNKGQFIRNGLWAWSRHPNYFGEITIWIGIAIMASSILQGFQWVAWVSPIFVIILLTKISGVPLLEAIADQRWGGQPEYEAYKKSTPVLMLRPPRLLTK